MEKNPQYTIRKLKKIAVVGPESTGKTTLAMNLAKYFYTHWVPEYARTFLQERNGVYSEPDLRHIAQQQLNLEDELAAISPEILICDTNLLVLKIWSEVRYGRCDPWILENFAMRGYDLHLLCFPDIPWKHDNLREHPDPEQRKELFMRYEAALVDHGFPYQIIYGSGDDRFNLSLEAIDNLQ